MHAVRITSPGGPERLVWTEVPNPTPEKGQVKVRVEAAGVNFVDVYQRNGLYPVDLPFTLGLEGAGVIDAVGEGVEHWRIGDRVAWFSAPGSYADEVIMDADDPVVVPKDVDLVTAAAVMLQGLTAHCLVRDVYPLEHGETCLVHAGAGGVGRLLIQMAVHAGARVFATAGTPEKRQMARDLGADLACEYEAFVEEIERSAGQRPIDVAYDGVGRTTFANDLLLMRRFGMVVLFGQSSGPVPPFDLQDLNRNGSLFVTRPTVFHYAATREDLERRARDVFGAIEDGWLDVLVGRTWSMPDAAEAHRALEARDTIGKVLLIPPRA